MKKTTRVAVPAKYREAQTATLEELMEKINATSGKVQSLQASQLKADLEGGTVETGKIEKYRRAPGYLIVQRPGWIRLNIQNPLSKTTVAEMVSDGKTFQIFIPSENKFIVGENRARNVGSDPLKNFRPQHLVQALLLEPLSVADGDFLYFLEEVRDETSKYYVIGLVAQSAPQRGELLRRLWIDRSNLELVRQQYFGRSGGVDSDIHYGGYRLFEGVDLPTWIRIVRVHEQYAVSLVISHWKINPETA
ncbi:MAG: DUF4292 domain-containing protein, partial [Acidobacteria bacterium]|nr:DUF4292 domain-containing protein [Acidobacteriota bacterium]